MKLYLCHQLYLEEYRSCLCEHNLSDVGPMFPSAWFCQNLDLLYCERNGLFLSNKRHRHIQSSFLLTCFFGNCSQFFWQIQFIPRIYNIKTSHPKQRPPAFWVCQTATLYCRAPVWSSFHCLDPTAALCWQGFHWTWLLLRWLR